MDRNFKKYSPDLYPGKYDNINCTNFSVLDMDLTLMSNIGNKTLSNENVFDQSLLNDSLKISSKNVCSPSKEVYRNNDEFIKTLENDKIGAINSSSSADRTTTVNALNKSNLFDKLFLKSILKHSPNDNENEINSLNENFILEETKSSASTELDYSYDIDDSECNSSSQSKQNETVLNYLQENDETIDYDISLYCNESLDFECNDSIVKKNSSIDENKRCDSQNYESIINEQQQSDNDERMNQTVITEISSVINADELLELNNSITNQFQNTTVYSENLDICNSSISSESSIDNDLISELCVNLSSNKISNNNSEIKNNRGKHSKTPNVVKTSRSPCKIIRKNNIVNANNNLVKSKRTVNKKKSKKKLKRTQKKKITKNVWIVEPIEGYEEEEVHEIKEESENKMETNRSSKLATELLQKLSLDLKREKVKTDENKTSHSVEDHLSFKGYKTRRMSNNKNDSIIKFTNKHIIDKSQTIYIDNLLKTKENLTGNLSRELSTINEKATLKCQKHKGSKLNQTYPVIEKIKYNELKPAIKKSSEKKHSDLSEKINKITLNSSRKVFIPKNEGKIPNIDKENIPPIEYQKKELQKSITNIKKKVSFAAELPTFRTNKNDNLEKYNESNDYELSISDILISRRYIKRFHRNDPKKRMIRYRKYIENTAKKLKRKYKLQNRKYVGENRKNSELNNKRELLTKEINSRYIQDTTKEASNKNVNFKSRRSSQVLKVENKNQCSSNKRFSCSLKILCGGEVFQCLTT
ncbi:hypothetical protein O3M35_006085 [Rhynocoris fuscipes]|uniref:Uncharacterized protein n=1 Tax=Rhynocoris fuscipes TaxID=488301 RepID=A0AAW1DC20_9HEMI